MGKAEDSKDRVEVKRTVNFEEFFNMIPRDSLPANGLKASEMVCYRIFDEVPIEEIREVCVSRLFAQSDFEVNWLTERVKAFLEIKDYPTVLMLLRKLALSSREFVLDGGKYEKDILGLMGETVKSCLEPEFRYCLKGALVILCGKMDHQPELYDERVREVFQSILEKYDRVKCGSEEEESRLLLRVFLSIARVGDKTFVPLLQKNILDQENLAHLIHYTSVCRDEIILEGVRMLVIRYLQNLE